MGNKKLSKIDEENIERMKFGNLSKRKLFKKYFFPKYSKE